jgi:hypothetical protein
MTRFLLPLAGGLRLRLNSPPAHYFSLQKRLEQSQ